MASIRDLKKDINYVLGDIIEGVYVWEAAKQQFDHAEANAIIDEAIAVFDDLIAKVNDKKPSNRKAHLTQVHNTLEEKANALIERLNKLS